MKKYFQTFIPKGMQQDLDVSKHNKDYAYEIKNFRIVSNGTAFSLVNESNIEITDKQYEGEKIADNVIEKFSDDFNTLGCVNVSNGVVIFGKTSTKDYILYIPITTEGKIILNPVSGIYEPKDNIKYSIIKLAQGNFNFSNKIEGLIYNYNNEFDRVYFIDGVNVLRYIDVYLDYDSKYKNTITTYYNSDGIALNTVNSNNSIITNQYSLQPIKEINDLLKVNVEKIENSNGSFPSGLIQYAITGVNIHAEESNILYLSRINYLTNNYIAVAEDATANCSFIITIKNDIIKNTLYKYFNIYSIIYTSTDVTVNLVNTVANTYTKTTTKDIVIYDYNINSTTLSSTDLFFKNIVNIIPYTMCVKDNTLFLGNYSSENITSDITLTADDYKLYFDYCTITIDTITGKLFDSSYQLDKDEYYTKHFKYGEKYCIGIQLKNTYGHWTDTMYLKIIECDKKLHCTKYDMTNGKTYYKIPKLIFEFTESDNSTKIKNNYVSYRLVYKEKNINEYTTIAQGFVAPTVFNRDHRNDGTVFSQASWVIRPEYLYGTEVTADLESLENLYNTQGSTDTAILLPSMPSLFWQGSGTRNMFITAESWAKNTHYTNSRIENRHHLPINFLNDNQFGAEFQRGYYATNNKLRFCYIDNNSDNTKTYYKKYSDSINDDYYYHKVNYYSNLNVFATLSYLVEDANFYFYDYDLYYKKTINYNGIYYGDMYEYNDTYYENSDINNTTLTFNKNFKQYTLSNINNLYFVDKSIVTFHSPDLDIPTSISSSYNFNNYKFRITGIAQITSSKGEDLTEAKDSNIMFVQKNNSSATDTRDTSFTNDSFLAGNILCDTNGFFKTITNKNEVSRHPITLFTTTLQEADDTHRGELQKHTIANFRYCKNTSYFYNSSTENEEDTNKMYYKDYHIYLPTTDIKIFDSDEVVNMTLKDPNNDDKTINYRGNISEAFISSYRCFYDYNKINNKEYNYVKMSTLYPYDVLQTTINNKTSAIGNIFYTDIEKKTTTNTKIKQTYNLLDIKYKSTKHAVVVFSNYFSEGNLYQTTLPFISFDSKEGTDNYEYSVQAFIKSKNANYIGCNFTIGSNKYRYSQNSFIDIFFHDNTTYSDHLRFIDNKFKDMLTKGYTWNNNLKFKFDDIYYYKELFKTFNVIEKEITPTVSTIGTTITTNVLTPVAIKTLTLNDGSILTLNNNSTLTLNDDTFSSLNDLFSSFPSLKDSTITQLTFYDNDIVSLDNLLPLSSDSLNLKKYKIDTITLSDYFKPTSFTRIARNGLLFDTHDFTFSELHKFYVKKDENQNDVYQICGKRMHGLEGATTYEDRDKNFKISVSNQPFSYVYIGEIYKDNTQIYNDNIENGTWLICSDETKTSNKCDKTYGDWFFQRYNRIKTIPFSEGNEMSGIVDIFSCMLETRINLDGNSSNKVNMNDILYKRPETFDLYNDVYSRKNNYFTFSYTSAKKLFNFTKFGSSVIYSLTKLKNDNVDSWLHIDVYNSYDLDYTLGDIKRLFNFGNEIIVFQEKGIGKIQYNVNQIMSSDSGLPIQLKSVEGISGHDYITKTSGINNKWSSCLTNNGIFYIDCFDNSLKLLSGDNTNISQTYLMQSWFDKRIDYLNYDYNSSDSGSYLFYDYINNELRINFNKDKVNNYTLVFNNVYKTFTSLYEYNDKNNNKISLTFNFKHNNYIYGITSTGDIYRYFTNDYSYMNSYITLISNENPFDFKTYDVLQFRGETLNPFKDTKGIPTNNDRIEKFSDNNTLYGNITPYNVFLSENDILQSISPIDSIRFWNEYQDTGETLIKNKFTKFNRRNRIWSLFIPRNNSNVEKELTFNVKRTQRISNLWTMFTLYHNNSELNHKIRLHDITLHYFMDK